MKLKPIGILLAYPSSNDPVRVTGIPAIKGVKTETEGVKLYFLTV